MSNYGWTISQRKTFNGWLRSKDPIIAMPNVMYAPRIFKEVDVVRDYLEREIPEERTADEFKLDMKVCIHCGNEYPVADYYLTPSGRRMAVCRACKIEQQHAYLRRLKEEEKSQTQIKKKMETKICKTCGRELPLDMFSPIARSKSDATMPNCKSCMTNLKRAGLAKRKEKAIAATAPADVETAVAVEPDPATQTVVEGVLEINKLPFNTVEIPASGWLAYIPDDILYAELIHRGWQGPMTKTLTTQKAG